MFKRCILIVSLLFVVSLSLFAQSDYGFTITPDPELPEVFIAGPPEQIPVIRDDMPWDVVLAYMVLDTICKTYTAEEIKGRLQNLSEDSLLIAWHILQRADDYGPFLVQYMVQYTEYHHSPEYLTSYGEPLFLLNREYFARYKGIDRDNILEFPSFSIPQELIRMSSGIYLVRCLSLSNRAATYDQYMYGPNCPDSVYWADVEVLQVYSGVRHYSNCNPSDHEISGTCIRFTWHNRSCDSSGWARKSLIPGKDYLVFANVGYGEGDDIENEPYSKWQMTIYNRFEVVNGYVLDTNQYFDLGSAVPLSDIEGLIQDTNDELTGR